MRYTLLVLLLLAGCKDGEKVVCPAPIVDMMKEECINYGAAYIETKDKVYCHTTAGLIMERHK